jgi:hypothetical protein
MKHNNYLIISNNLMLSGSYFEGTKEDNARYWCIIATLPSHYVLRNFE